MCQNGLGYSVFNSALNHMCLDWVVVSSGVTVLAVHLPILFDIFGNELLRIFKSQIQLSANDLNLLL